jgi:hypothetical protein
MFSFCKIDIFPPKIDYDEFDQLTSRLKITQIGYKGGKRK